MRSAPIEMGPKTVAAGQIVLALALFVLDSMTPPGIADGIGYSAVIVLSLWIPHRRYVLGAACVATLLVVAAEFLSPPGGVGDAAILNRILAVSTIWILWFLMDHRLQIVAALRRGEQ